jgi:glutamate/tyrosine decarboxylase-like PLP-dependent enzyme
MCLKAYGVEKFARLIEQNVDQANYLADRVQCEPELELLAPVSLNIVCFRFAPSVMPEEKRNALNRELLMRLQESGVAIPSSTQIGDKFAIRTAIVNHRSRIEDFDLLIDTILKIGRELITEGFKA